MRGIFCQRPLRQARQRYSLRVCAVGIEIPKTSQNCKVLGICDFGGLGLILLFVTLVIVRLFYSLEYDLTVFSVGSEVASQ